MVNQLIRKNVEGERVEITNQIVEAGAKLVLVMKSVDRQIVDGFLDS